MKNDYVKTLLYAYVHIPNITKRIDEIVLKKALGSMTDFSFCVKQCEKIVFLTIQKALLVEGKYYLERAMSRLTKEEKKLLRYKYFRQTIEDCYTDLETSNRNYFRKQTRLVQTLADNLKWLNKDDEWFEKRILRVPFMRKLYNAVKRKDQTFILSACLYVADRKKMVA